MIKPQTVNHVLTLAGVLFCSISDGFIFGQMSGMLADLQSPNSTIPLSADDVSWIGSVINMTCVCGFALTIAIAEFFGRRHALVILNVPIICVWITVYYAQDMTTFMLTRVVTGACFGGVLQMSFIVTAEYFSPKYRNLYLTLISAVGPSIGTTLGHILSLVLHWKIVALIGIIPTGLSALLPCFWVESPSWLASKGRFAACEKSFRALHVSDTSSEKELELLIRLEHNKRTVNEQSKLKRLIKLIKRKDLQRILMLSFMIGVYRTAAGKILFSTYAITMLHDLTGKSDILLTTLLIDGFAIMGSVLSCVFISRMRARTLFISTSAVANLILFALSFCIYFGPKNVYFSWLIAVLLAAYFILANSGPYPVLEALTAEIFPLEVKLYCSFIFGCVGSVMMFLSTKLAPAMFSTIGYHGVFFLNAWVMLLCYVYFWLKMPETKGRTLQEIEYFFKNNAFEDVREEQICSLVQQQSTKLASF